MKKKNITIILVVIAIIILVVLLLSIDAVFKIKSTQTTSGEISNFEECAAAGNKVGESYPRQCWIDDGRRFVEVINDAWKLDDIRLRQHETEGWHGCFGCSVAVGDSPALCVDPIKEMRVREETPERYCNNDFEVVENGEAGGWRNDRVSLAYIPESNNYACFGCANKLCVDPGPGVKFVEETPDRHCSDDFQVIEVNNGAVCGNNICEVGEADIEGGCGPNADPRCLGPPDYSGTCPKDCEFTDCLPEQRNVEGCDDYLEPVCGTVNVQCVTAPCNPIKETFSNKCYACIDESVTGYIKGGCF